jgi:glycogen operon protein
LRVWAVNAGLDGFRLDLATTLGRRADGFDPAAPLLAAMQQDPVLSRCAIIAEPWDIGPGGYQLGGFPAGWGEWNDQFRDTVRRFWRGDPGVLGDLATRFAGSADIFAARHRPLSRGINFVTAHDGFTLADLVAYSSKRNDANGEGNRDGTDDNRSWNCGAEGPSDDPGIAALRERQQRNFLATLFLSQGVPMLLGGDEFGRTQSGNNNAWCQDNAISWYGWEHEEWQQRLLAFTRRLILLRAEHPVFRRTEFLAGREQEGSGLPDAWWFRADGRRMTQRDWANKGAGTLGVFLNGDEITETTREGEPIVDDCFLLLFNAHHDDVEMRLPNQSFGQEWALELSTLDPELAPGAETFLARDTLPLAARSLLLLKRSRPQRRGG